MHTQSMSEDEGTFSEPQPVALKCRQCGGGPVEKQQWDSDCGGYEDERFSCAACGYAWWVEGIDS